MWWTPPRIVFDVAERTAKKGQYLLVPEVEVDTYWTSLEDDSFQTVLLYHDHGTCEQFHSEIKSDMDLERRRVNIFRPTPTLWPWPCCPTICFAFAGRKAFERTTAIWRIGRTTARRRRDAFAHGDAGSDLHGFPDFVPCKAGVFVLRTLQSLGRCLAKSLPGVYEPSYVDGQL